MKVLAVLFLSFLLAGCASSFSSQDLKPAGAAQATPPPDTTASAKPRVKQWFTTDTPETLPQDKLDKMNLSGGGFAGAY
jgi:hypothetical protein